MTGTAHQSPVGRNALHRQGIAVSTATRSFFREPTNVALVVLLPPVVVLGFDLALEAFVEVPGTELPAAAGELGGALFATAFLAGLLGVFQVVGSAGPDRRLVVCGYQPWEVLLARILTIIVVGVGVAMIAYATFTLLADVSPDSPVRAIFALGLTAITYGLLGVIIGGLIGRELEGSLVLVFFADLDTFLAAGVVPVDTDLVEYLPLARPYSLFESAVLTGTLPVGDAIEASLYALALLAIALGTIYIRGASR